MNQIIWKSGKWLNVYDMSIISPQVGDIILPTRCDKDYVNGFSGMYPVETRHFQTADNELAMMITMLKGKK